MGQNRHAFKYLFVILVSISSVVACSPQQNGAGSAPAAATTTASTSGNTATTTATNMSLANCSRDVAGASDLAMNLEVYSANGQQNTNFIRVRFSSFPSNFSNSNSQLTFWVNGTDANGNFTGLTEVPFIVEYYAGTGNFTDISGEIYSLSLAQLQNLATSKGVSTTNAAASLQNITFLVDVSSLPSATVLNANLYYNGVATTLDRTLQALMPNFYANPNNYVSTHNKTLLALHPFSAYMNSSHTESDYAAMAQQLCF